MKPGLEQMHLMSVKAQPVLPIPASVGCCCDIEWLEVVPDVFVMEEETYSALRQAREILAQDWKGQSNNGGGEVDELHVCG
jgi:hypothetical protein